MTDLIRATLERPDEWDELDRLSFPSRVKLARAQGELTWPAALFELNRMRNKIAHQPRFEIDLPVALALARSFEDDFGCCGEKGDFGTAPDPSVLATPAEAIRASLESILDYLMRSTADVLEAKVRRLQDATERLLQLVNEKRSGER